MRGDYLTWAEARVRLRWVQAGYARSWRGRLWDWWRLA